jgi:hypothetical protein
MKPIATAFGLLCAALAAGAAPNVPLAPAAPSWDAWKPLVGEWVGEGSGKPGQGMGGFSFAFDLQDRILVRKNFAEYPAADGRPASRHEDLMVLWQTAEGTRASYWDNEGHAIEYRCRAEEKAWTCETHGATPGFRLRYTQKSADELGITFEISPSGKPDAFKPYITAGAHRKAKP